MKLPRNAGTFSITTFDFLFAVVLLCYPALLFLIQGGMNASLFLLAAFSLFLLARHRDQANYFGKEQIIFAIAMSSGLGAIFISQLYHQDMTARYFDSAARFLLAIPILLASGFIKERVFFIVQYAFPLGALAAFVAILLPHPSFKFFTELVTTMMSSDARYSASTSYMNHIHLGDLALMLGCLSLFSVNWIQPDHLGVKLLKITGMIAGLAVSILSGARGGWIAIPIFVGVFVIFRTRGKFFNKIAVAGLLLGAIGLAGYFSVEAIHQGVRSIYSDLTSFSAGNVDTSQGGRLQLWKAALHLIAENPVFGVGADGFGKAMDGLSATGFITPFAASAGKGEVHNEILANTVRFGIFGLLSILAIYFVPFFLFLRAAKSGTQQQIGAAMMGMCLTLGFFVFGLSVETFNLKMTAAFYSLTVAVLLAATYKTSGNNVRAPHGNMEMPHGMQAHS
jgi:O-antigen ligase